MPAFGRRASPDERDRNFPMRLALDVAAELPSYRYWTPGPVLNQGDFGICVGAGWSGWLQASPLRTRNGPAMDVIYCRACGKDVWHENDADCTGSNPMQSGTSVRAGAEVMIEDGRVSEYRWAESVDDIERWLALRGPVVLGVLWTDQMLETDRAGRIRAEGTAVGGHCVLLIGVNRTKRLVRGINSWGAGWGQRGRFWLSYDDLARLLAMNGEACVAIEQRPT